MTKCGVEKEKFAEYISSEVDAQYEDEELRGVAPRALREYTLRSLTKKSIQQKLIRNWT